jgi:hypothetical protein
MHSSTGTLSICTFLNPDFQKLELGGAPQAFVRFCETGILGSPSECMAAHAGLIAQVKTILDGSIDRRSDGKPEGSDDTYNDVRAAMNARDVTLTLCTYVVWCRQTQVT